MSKLPINGLAFVIRSHQVVDQGYESFAEGQLYTVFSASNYQGSAKNRGAILQVTIDGRSGRLTITARTQYADSQWDYNARDCGVVMPWELRGNVTYE